MLFKVSKKYPYLKSETEKLFQFIKDYQRVESNEEIDLPNFSDKMTKWISDTKETYGVNVIAFIYGYMNKFLNEEDKWPRIYKKKVKIIHIVMNGIMNIIIKRNAIYLI
ncbi:MULTISPECIES: hypothetical protein [unclassified Clostridium]|uniref:hypothetical protein n=1 Tax=unclassified Clostridium TaxID=2614128 RepID=UPI00207A67F6|nr:MULTISPECIES: hypothetical protein [unclassified Clostridium]